MPTVTIDRVEFGYDEVGEGPCIVFLHGWMCNRRFWDPLIAPLVRQRRVVSLDFRGQGESSIPADGYTVEQLATDVRDVFTMLGIDEAVIVGHSMGGMVAQQFALDHPSRTAGLVLVTTVASALGDALISKRIDKAVTNGEASFRDAFDRHFGDWFAPTTSEEVIQWVKDHMLRTPETVALALVRAYGQFDQTNRLGEIQVPTLVVGATSDNSAVPAQAQQLADCIPGADLCVIGECGHFPMLERVEELAERFAQFLGF